MFDFSNGVDASRNGHTLLVQGTASFTPARGGHAVSLDGSGGWLERQYDPAFTPGTSSWSVCGWVNAPLDTTGAHDLVSWYRCGADAGCGSIAGPRDNSIYQMALTPHGNAEWFLRDDADTIRDIITAQSFSDSQWHFLVGVRDSAAAEVDLYVDGVLAGSQTLPPSSLTAGGISIPLEVGRLFVTGWAQPQQYLRGMIDDVRIYRSALTAADVAALWGDTLAVGRDGPTEVSFAPAEPNPFRHATELRFSLPVPGQVRMTVFDVSGRRVRVLLDGPRAAASQAVEWDGRNDAGIAAPAGIYLCRLETRLGGSMGELRTSRAVLIP